VTESGQKIITVQNSFEADASGFWQWFVSGQRPLFFLTA
jgi:hypothetical protein